MTTRLTLADVETIAFALAREDLRFDQPIPPFDTRFPGVLESCLSVPHQVFGGQSPYRSLTAKAAILFYLLIKNHPFQNGNKRIAFTSLLVFLSLNNRWLDAEVGEAYRLAVAVASSEPAAKDLIVAGIRGFLEDRIKSVGPPPPIAS